MTDQTIPPCPVCGKVPIIDAQFDDECKPQCNHISSPVATIMIDDWTHSCNYELGRACRELGVETVEQLKARLAPDPRAAVAVEALEKLARLGNGDRHGNSIGNCIAIDALKQIAAQRGEG